MKPKTATEQGVALVRALIMTLGAVPVGAAGLAAAELGGHWLLGVPLWVGAAALLWKARPAIIKEMRESDRQEAYPLAVLDTGSERRDCPCCRCPTWEESSDTCRLCDWADDITTGSGALIPLAAARANFALHRSVYPQEDRPPWSPEPLSPEEIRLRRQLQATYRKIQRGQPRCWFRARELETRVSSMRFDELE
jgi:hypothetical protein